MQSKFKKITPYFIIIISFAACIIIFYYVVDELIMPWIIHGSEVVKVPNLVGKSLPEAQETISKLNLVSNKTGEQYNDKFLPNTVISQIPKPGTEVKAGRYIYMIVSKGQETTPVPYLIGKSLREAKIMLTRKGLQVGEVQFVGSDSIGTDTIISQNIQSGRDVSTGTSINLIVSKGPESAIKVPSLIGVSLSEANALLKESSLNLGSIAFEKSETFMVNTIISQSPRQGELVPKNSVINVVLSK